jgi:hypothetical protein
MVKIRINLRSLKEMKEGIKIDTFKIEPKGMSASYTFFGKERSIEETPESSANLLNILGVLFDYQITDGMLVVIWVWENKQLHFEEWDEFVYRWELQDEEIQKKIIAHIEYRNIIKVAIMNLKNKS